MKLKIKMLKRMISVLCSVVISTSVLITSVGAVDGKKHDMVYKKNPLSSNGAFTIKKPVNGFDKNKSIVMSEEDLLRDDRQLDFGEFDRFENLSDSVEKISGEVDSSTKSTRENFTGNSSSDEKKGDENFDDSINLDIELIESFNKSNVNSNHEDEDNVNLGNSFDLDMGLNESFNRIKREKNDFNDKGKNVLNFSEFSDLDMELSESLNTNNKEENDLNYKGEDILNFGEFSDLDMELGKSFTKDKKDKIDSIYEDGDIVNLGDSFNSKIKANEAALLKEKNGKNLIQERKPLPKLFKKKIINSKKVLNDKSQKNSRNVFKKKIIKSKGFFSNKKVQDSGKKPVESYMKAAEKIQAIWKGHDFRKKEDLAYAMVVLHSVFDNHVKSDFFKAIKEETSKQRHNIVKDKVSGARIFKSKQ